MNGQQLQDGQKAQDRCCSRVHENSADPLQHSLLGETIVLIFYSHETFRGIKLRASWSNANHALIRLDFQPLLNLT